MPDLLLELFSEEIPARMQTRAAADLARLAGEALAPLAPTALQGFHGPRRIALAARLQAALPASSTVERGPRLAAPEQALAGFLRKHGASRAMASQADGYWVLHKEAPGAIRRRPGRRRAAGPAAALSLAEIDALGRLRQPVHLGSPAAPHRLPAGRRAGPVRPARRRR